MIGQNKYSAAWSAYNMSIQCAAWCTWSNMESQHAALCIKKFKAQREEKCMRRLVYRYISENQNMDGEKVFLVTYFKKWNFHIF